MGLMTSTSLYEYPSHMVWLARMENGFVKAEHFWKAVVLAIIVSLLPFSEKLPSLYASKSIAVPVFLALMHDGGVGRLHRLGGFALSAAFPR